jgi:glutamate-5-semialdehyde dehydrogenase
MTTTDVTPDQLISEMGRRARRAALDLANVTPAAKNDALGRMARAFDTQRDRIREENARDLEAARKRGLAEPMVERLALRDKGIDGIIAAAREIAALADPVGEIDNVRIRPNGLKVGQLRAPIGVIGMIYESRPNVTLDAGALCLKSGNAVILRGGSEAFHSNTILASIMTDCCREAGIPDGAIQLVPTTDREAVGALLRANQYVDLIIPRGGKGLIRRIVEESSIPVIKHLDGNCHVYVDESADLDMAVKIVLNSKMQRTSVCNAAESLLVHASVAKDFLPRCLSTLHDAGCELRGCDRTRSHHPAVKIATDEDWEIEYLDKILAIKVVDSFDEAVDHINVHGSHHTEAIVTRDWNRANAFMRRVDSACLHVNASTRFADGGEYGLGAEIGISTDRLHARGPMGLLQLTIPKWIVLGDGQVRG